MQETGRRICAARGIDPADIFSAVAEEVRRLLDADHAGIGRFEPDGTAIVVVAGVGDDPLTLSVGRRVELRDYLPPAAVWRTGRPARVDDGAAARVLGLLSGATRRCPTRDLVRAR